MTYPLPSYMRDLQRLLLIPLSPTHSAGNMYLERAIAKFKGVQSRRVSAVNDIRGRRRKVASEHTKLTKEFKEMRAQAQEAVEGVKQQAAQAVASLTDLFALGRRGLESQMQAHLNGSDWQGEHISAAAFRDCFRMVTQAVKGLGLPSDQRDRAAEAIMQEVADSLEATREVVAAASGNTETEH